MANCVDLNIINNPPPPPLVPPPSSPAPPREPPILPPYAPGVSDGSRDILLGGLLLVALAVPLCLLLLACGLIHGIRRTPDGR